MNLKSPVLRPLATSLALLGLAGCDLPTLLGPGMVPSAPAERLPALPGDQLDGPAILPNLVGSGLQIPAAIKIGLSVAQADVAFEVATAAQAGPGGADLSLQPGRTYRVRRSGANLVLSEAGKDLLHSASPIEIAPSSAGTAGLVFSGRKYRGSFRFIASPSTSDKTTLINVVAPEDYLYGVVPVEMSSGWPLEALKTQAVAARTYAIANLGRRASLGFDLYDTVSDQVYKGFSVEKPDTTSAVDATRGQILTWQDRPIAAFFHSSSGGETDDALAVWGQDLPYIQGAKDLDPSPNAEWNAWFEPVDVSKALVALGHDVGNLQNLEVTTWTPHGRARWLKASGSAGSATVDANKLRLKLGLKSTRYKLTRELSSWKFAGGGWGHGLGMSQWGARAYATQGESYRDILARYYYQSALTGTAN